MRQLIVFRVTRTSGDAALGYHVKAAMLAAYETNGFQTE
jgi:hypothetical protein